MPWSLPDAGFYSRRENTAEHSWHVALFALVLAPHAAERIDVLRVVSMLLIYDLVEIDCGDTPLFDEVEPARRPRVRAVAARRLFGMLPTKAGDRISCALA